jgi:replicative DNA helicase
MQSQNKKNHSSVAQLDFSTSDRLPPQNIDAEEAILGGILLDPEAIERVADILPAKAFYINHHKEIYKAALTLHSQDKPTDLMSVTTWLYDHELLEKVGGQSKLGQLVERTVSAVNIDRYAQFVREKYFRRQLIQAGNEIVQLGYETSIELDEVVNQAEHKIFSFVQSDQLVLDVEAPVDLVYQIYDQLSQIKPKGLSTGIYELDTLIGGLKPKKLYVIAARSGIGKTHLAIFLTGKLLKANAPVVFFSAEMDRQELMTRLLALESGIDSKKIDECTITSEDDFAMLSVAAKSISSFPFYLDDTPGSYLTPMKMRSGIRRATSLYGKPRLVVLDYLQLLGDESGKMNRVTELDNITRACKVIAREFDVPFLALAQINRSVESQNDKRPQLSNLRESGAIEQTADVVMMLYRDEYYNENTSDKGICELIIRKQRGGNTGTVKTIFQPEISRFLNIANR